MNLLRYADMKFDGQIGEFGDATEQVLDASRAISLFELKDLEGLLQMSSKILSAG